MGNSQKKIRAGDNLNKIRISHGLSTDAFSAKCSIPADTLKNYLYGDWTPRVKLLLQICNSLKVSPNEVFDGMYEPTGELNLMGSIESAMNSGIKAMRVGTIITEMLCGDYPELSKKFDRRLKVLREKAGYSKEDFADQVGITLGTIKQYESGQVTPSGETFLSICRVLKVSPEYILSGDLTFALSHDVRLYRLTPKHLAYLDDILRVIS